MLLYSRCDGVAVEPVSEVWAAFSPISGETILLNNESAAILEVLVDGPATTQQVAEQLAQDMGESGGGLHDLIAGCWSTLIDAGLVQQQLPTAVHIGR